MTIPSRSRGNKWNSNVSNPLDEIQIDTVPSPEPVEVPSEFSFNYFLTICDRYSRMVRLIGIRNKITEACIDGLKQIISNILGLRIKFSKNITHIMTDLGSEFRLDTFQKRYGDHSICFTYTVPKYQEQNGSIERHCRTSVKLANTILSHARLDKKSFIIQQNVCKESMISSQERIFVIKKSLPTTSYLLLLGPKTHVKHFEVLGCRIVFKKYDASESGKRTRSKYIQQGTRGIFVDLPDHSTGWLFYIPDTK